MSLEAALAAALESNGATMFAERHRSFLRRFCVALCGRQSREFGWLEVASGRRRGYAV